MKRADEIVIRIVKDGKPFGTRHRWSSATAMLCSASLEDQLHEVVEELIQLLKKEDNPELREDNK